MEIILGGKLPPVNVHAENSILVSSDFRSVRLDIYANDEIEVNYNVEAQNKNEENLPKRSHYHQAEMDVSSLKPGQDFNDLKPGYVIFICTFDPFGKKLYRYTFEERCLERDFPFGDETKKITELKKERDLEARYMTFEELLRVREKDGIVKGKVEAILELLEDYDYI